MKPTPQGLFAAGVALFLVAIIPPWTWASWPPIIGGCMYLALAVVAVFIGHSDEH